MTVLPVAVEVARGALSEVPSQGLTQDFTYAARADFPDSSWRNVTGDGLGKAEFAKLDA